MGQALEQEKYHCKFHNPWTVYTLSGTKESSQAWQWWQRHRPLILFKASLVYEVSSRTARAVTENPASKNKNHKPKQQQKKKLVSSSN